MTTNNSRDREDHEKAGAGGSKARQEEGQGQGQGSYDVIDNRVYVGGVPVWMNEPDLFNYFLKFGQVETAIIIDKSVQSSINRYGFITFKACSVGAVRKLLHDTDATELTVRGGRTLTVGPARQRKYQPGHQGWSGAGRGHYTEFRRRPGHHQPGGGRRGDRYYAEDWAPAPRRHKEARRNAAKEMAEVAAEKVDESQIPITELPQQQQQAAMELYGGQVGAMLEPVEIGDQVQMYEQYPGGVPGYPMMTNYGAAAQYYSYTATEQMMVVPGAYNLGSYWPGHASVPTYNQSQYYNLPYQQQPGLEQPAQYPSYDPYSLHYLHYLQQPDYNYCQQQMMEPLLSDSGFHDVTAASLLYGDTTQPQETVAALAAYGQESEVEASPVLNMSQVLTTAPLQPQPAQLIPGVADSAGGRRCYDTPNKQFAPFTGGSHLDPQGNKFPFVRGGKHVRRFSAGDHVPRKEGGPVIIKKPIRDQSQAKEMKEVASKYKEGKPRRLTTSSQANNELQEAVEEKLTIK